MINLHGGIRLVMDKKEKSMIAIGILLFVLILPIMNFAAYKKSEGSNISSTLENSTILFVNPETLTVDVGQTFSVDIYVSNVIDLYGWEFKLRWNLTLLDALNITEGDFLRSYGDTLFVINVNNTEGWLRAACTLIGGIPGVNGSGILATVEFYAESVGQTMLDLYDTKLVNSCEESIQHSAHDGYVYISFDFTGGGSGFPCRKLLK